MMAKFKVIVAVSAFSGVLVLGTGLIAQQNTGGGLGQTPVAPSIKSLIEARLKVAKEVFETTMEPPLNKPLADMPEWSRRWMDEQIRLDASPNKRTDAIQEHLNRLKNLEAIADQRHEAARGTHVDALKVRYYRLEAEQMLAEIQIINPNRFPPSPAARP